MAFRYGIRNDFRPSTLAPQPFGWRQAPAYNRADVPTQLVDESKTGMTSLELAANFAYEWFQSGTATPGMTNPPFTSGAAGRILPSLHTTAAAPPRILRGYIRRTQFDTADPITNTRLYFMYNPTEITRDYVSYLEQGALDPFNTVYQSGNLVAPPSILDFTFSLMFDRQEEAAERNNPGVLADYQYFDMVVRNVVPSATIQNGALPDNGVMMVNPRDIAVIFSPEITVQGRPLNARVSFTKFTHRMTPTRMTIDLTIRATYIGPVKDMQPYQAEVFAAETSIPIDEIKQPDYIINFNGLTLAEGEYNGQFPAGTAPSGNAANYGAQAGLAATNNSQARKAALDYAYANVIQGTTRYAYDGSGLGRTNLPTSAECSGLVTKCYKATGSADAVGWGSYPGTAQMLSILRQRPQNFDTFPIQYANNGNCAYGDILLKNGHVRFFVRYSGTKLVVFDAASRTSSPQVGERQINPLGNEYQVIRPKPLGSDMSYNATNGPH